MLYSSQLELQIAIVCLLNTKCLLNTTLFETFSKRFFGLLVLHRLQQMVFWTCAGTVGRFGGAASTGEDEGDRVRGGPDRLEPHDGPHSGPECSDPN